MSTGDLNGNLQRLLRDLKAIKFPTDVDEVGLRLGDPVAFLPLLNFILIKFSRHVARFIVRHGFELAGKTDQRFVESCFKLFRDVLNVRTVLTPAQFFEQGYAERKVLLVCDAIAACKKLHNEEVRQERLAALKANRQEQSSSRLAAPRRASPQVKVVRNDDIEIHQVLAPEHLPNASDGSQSVYKTKKLVKTSRSPSPSPSGQSAVAKMGPRVQASPNVLLSAGKGQSLELTFRPVVTSNAGPRQAPPSSAAPAPPIHTWFMNPAFADEGVGELGLGAASAFDVTGRPDSSAWWRPALNAPEEQAAPQWQGLSAFPSRAAGQPDGAINTLGVTGGRELFFGQQPTVLTTSAPRSELKQAVQQTHVLSQQQTRAQEKDLGRGAFVQRDPLVTVPGLSAAAAHAAAKISGDLPLPGAAVAGDRRSTVPARDLDEWSFSKFFGPSKVRQRRPAGGSTDDDMDDCSQHDADVDDRDAGEAPEGSEDMAGREDLERDGPAADQDRRGAASRFPATRSYASQATPSAHPAAPSPTRQRQRQGGTVTLSTAGESGSAGMHAAVAEKVDWPAKLAALEQETRAKLQQLQEKLSAAEQELEKTRVEGRQTREALQARVTVLEGRVRFLECELELCVKRAPGLELSPGGSSRQPSPRDAGTLVREPSLSWNATDRLHSTGDTAQHLGAPAPTVPSSSGAAADHLLPERLAAANASATSAADPYPYSSRGQGDAAHRVPERSRWTAAVVTGTTGSGTAVPGATQNLEDVRGTAAIPSYGGGAPPASHQPFRGISSDLRSQAGPAVAAAGAGSGPGGRLPGAASGVSLPSSQPGTAGNIHRLLPGFSPMPQPIFSFQPSRLMQQVASARAGVPAAAAPLAQLPPNHQQQLSRPLDALADNVDLEPTYSTQSKPHHLGSDANDSTSSVLGGSIPGGAFEPGVSVSAGNMYLGAGLVSTRVDAGLRPPGLGSSTDDASAATAVPLPSREHAGHIDAVAEPVGDWRGPERNVAATRADGRGSILDRAAIARGRAVSVVQHDDSSLRFAQPTAAASSANLQSHRHVESPAAQAAAFAAYPASHAPQAAAAAAGSSSRHPQLVNNGVGAGGSIAVMPAAPASGLAAASATGGSRTTEDVISSLYMRYTEAQDFLQTLRKR